MTQLDRDPPTLQANELASHLADAFSATGSGSASGQPWLWQALLQLLAKGEPVTEDGLAQATGHTVTDIRQALAVLPDTEYDEAGHIVGSGLTLRPTPHRFETGGRTLYTWCALDTLIFPAVLDQSARVTSPCHTTGAPIHVTVEPTKIVDVDPTTAVVSIVIPDGAASIRAAFCDQVHFFASSAAAKPWLEQHPGATVLPVADAFDLARPLKEMLLCADDLPGCC